MKIIPRKPLEQTNMKHIPFILCFFAMMHVSLLFGQTGGVSINTNNDLADPSAMLDVKSDSKGLLIPRVNLVSLVDNTQPVNNPALGLMIYNQDATYVSKGFYYWAGTQWNKLLTMQDLPDNSATNELQDLSLSGNTLSLSNSSSTIDLAPYLDGKWSSNNSDIYYNAGKVGIGTNTPQKPLEVAGDCRAGAFNTGTWVQNLGYNSTGTITMGWNGTIYPGSNYGSFILSVNIAQTSNGDGAQTIGQYAFVGGSDKYYTVSQLAYTSTGSFGAITITGDYGHININYTMGYDMPYLVIKWVRMN